MIAPTMEKRIELEKRGRPAEEITELNLDNCRATQIEGLSDDFKNLESLSLINVGLTTLKGFPNLPNLKRLELSDNRIPSGLNNLVGCPKLQYINLSGNKIKDIETLQPLRDYTELKNLDLFNCEVTNEDSYRDKVFELLGNLQYLDGYDRTGGEAEDEDEDDGDVDGVSDEEDDEDEDEDGVVDVDDEDDDDDDDEEGEDGVDDEDSEGEVGLDYLQKEDLSDDEEDDFEPGEEGEEEEEDEGENEDEGAEDDDGARGVKRKLEDQEQESNDA